MGENFVFLVIFDTYYVVYNWLISLLPPIVLDNLFGLYESSYNMYLLFIKKDTFLLTVQPRISASFFIFKNEVK